MIEEIIDYLKAVQIHDWIQTIGIIFIAIWIFAIGKKLEKDD